MHFEWDTLSLSLPGCDVTWADIFHAARTNTANDAENIGIRHAVGREKSLVGRSLGRSIYPLVG